MQERPQKITFAEMRSQGVRGLLVLQGWLSKVIDSLAAGFPFSIVHLLEFENRRLSSSNDQQTCGTKGPSFQGRKGLVWLRARRLHDKEPFGDGSNDRSSTL